jgi:YebC/PmpR family DNA-binding regulatory protein
MSITGLYLAPPPPNILTLYPMAATAQDMKRAKVFARIGKKIMMAVKAGGPNEDSNKALSDVLKEAKAYNVPKDNIVRVIKKATDGSEGDYKEAVYEVYAHGGVGLLITCLTDNTNRANVEIKTVCKKQDLQMAASGSVAFQFARKGRIEFKDGSAIEEDPVIEAALLADVDDVELVEGDEEGSKWALTEPTMLMALADALAASGMEGEPALVHVPNALVDVSDEDMEKNFLAIETLEALDDVDVVEHNMA